VAKQGYARDLRIITLKVPEEFLEVVDSVYRKLGFDHRSELIREAVRQFLERHGIEVPTTSRLRGEYFVVEV
jgi:metal-responsive CopG/Arc/MetJ family transcriptional regulator